MLRFHSPYDGRRIIGDNRKKIFHDSLYEPGPTTSAGCRIDRIPAADVRTFDPDSPYEAGRQGFEHCPHCLGLPQSLHE